MAWQRTIPFGYQMRQGRMECNTVEAETVKDIFARYLQGESLQRIATAVTAQDVRYHERAECWNKHMVKRILENKRYLGDGQYPSMIGEKDFLTAQMLKTGRNDYSPCKVSAEVRGKTICGRCGTRLIRTVKNRKTARWKCENSDCGHTAHISDEGFVVTVNALLDVLAHTPEALIPRIPQAEGKHSDAQRLANELTNTLNRGTESIEYLRSLVFACAAERYNELPDNSLQYQVDKLRERMESGETERTLPAKLLETAVRSIRVTDAENITLELVNGQIIAKEAAET